MSKESTPVTAMIYGEVARQLAPDIIERFPSLNVVFGSRDQSASANYQDVQFLVGWRFAPGVFGRMPDLRWIQSVAVGVEDWIEDPSIPPNTVVTNVKGIYSDAIGEYVGWALLTLSRQFHKAIINQVKRRWIQQAGEELSGKVVGIAGLGSVGKAVAARVKALGMHTVGIARNPDPVIQFNHIDETVSVTQLDEVLPKIDALVLCLPLTPETDHMIGLSELQAMKKGAILINVARAGVLDYQSVVSELKNGHLGGAAIDVFEKEPLKRWSRLWGVDNLLITPHIGAVTSNYREGISDLVCDNISRYLNSQEMKNVVNRLKGY